ncbi:MULTISPECIES: hypothetical protein [Saccharopolyspora]|uniref:Uncharacterized protein n=1 Tax=Saccharopolyspora cebuensis TaxID=418759 RepID=A0ABV4CEN2_9PSEU
MQFPERGRALARARGRRGGKQKGGKEVATVWVALLVEAVVLLGMAGAAVKWVNRSPESNPDQAIGATAPALEPAA